MLRIDHQHACSRGVEFGSDPRLEDAGLLRQYLEKMTGLSRTQVTRLIARHRQQGKVEVTVYRRHRFAPRYPAADVELLAHVDEEHQRLSGPATRHILEREYREYGKENSMGVLNCKMGMSANF